MVIINKRMPDELNGQLCILEAIHLEGENDSKPIEHLFHLKSAACLPGPHLRTYVITDSDRASTLNTQATPTN